jgi:hypothetical protein
MKKKTQFLLEAAVVFAIAFTLLLPTTMANTNEEQTTTASLDIVWEDNFDSYDLGQFLDGDPEDGGWKGWDDDPQYGSFVVDTQVLSSPHSIEIAGLSDTVQQYTGLVAGTFVYTAYQFVPNDFVGQSYFILLSHYEVPATQESCKWAVQIRFDSDLGIVESEHGGPSTDLITGQWVELRTEIDLDADSYSFYYNGELLETKAWTAGPNNGFDGYLEISAVDLFANGATAVYYDDMVLEGVIILLPELSIEDIAGGLGRVSAVINNIGDDNATDVEWDITLDGGLIILGKQTEGTEAIIAPGEGADIQSGFILGLGKTTIRINADCAEGVDDSAQADGTVLLFFVIVK